MTERFYLFIENSIFALGLEGAFALCVGVVFVCALLGTVLAICMRRYSLKKRLWYFLSVFSAFSLQICSVLYNNENLGSAFFVLFVGLLLSLPLLSIRERKKEPRAEQDLIKMIDTEISKQSLSDFGNKITNGFEREFNFDFNEKQNELTDKRGHIKSYKCVEQVDDIKKKQNVEIDFSHVKNVMENMEYYKLSPTDKKQLKDLETAVYSAENGFFNQEIKNRINDGLGALLKIMAKHGV